MSDPSINADGYRDWSHPDAMKNWQAERAREQAIAVATGKSAMDRAMDCLAGSAMPVAEHMLNDRVAYFRERPQRLDLVFPGLSMMSGTAIVATVESLLESDPRRGQLRWQREFKAARRYGRELAREQREFIVDRADDHAACVAAIETRDLSTDDDLDADAARALRKDAA